MDPAAPSGPRPSNLPPDAERDSVQEPGGKISMVKPSKGYPLAVCVVTGDDLAMVGEPVAIVVDGVEIQLCCEHCVAEVRKDPVRYAAMVRRATPAR
jgi:hypothetical protein